VFRRIDFQHAAAEHGQRPAAGFQRAAMGRAVDATGQAADDRQPGPGETAGQPLRLGCPVMRGMPRADNGDSQHVRRLHFTAHEQDARRIVNLGEHARVGRIGRNQHVNTMLPAESQLGRSVDLLAGSHNFPAELRPYALDFTQRAGRGIEHGGGGAKMVQERLECPRPDAGDEREGEPVEEIYRRRQFWRGGFGHGTVDISH